MKETVRETKRADELKPPDSCAGLEPEWTGALATEAEVSELREQAARAQKIADIRALADWLEANPGLPIPIHQGFQVSPGLDVRGELDVWNSAAQGIALVKQWAEVMGEPVDESLVDRTTVAKRFGSLEYKAIAWHRDGRPSEPVVAELEAQR